MEKIKRLNIRVKLEDNNIGLWGIQIIRGFLFLEKLSLKNVSTWTRCFYILNVMLPREQEGKRGETEKWTQYWVLTGGKWTDCRLGEHSQKLQITFSICPIGWCVTQSYHGLLYTTPWAHPHQMLLGIMKIYTPANVTHFKSTSPPHTHTMYQSLLIFAFSKKQN